MTHRTDDKHAQLLRLTGAASGQVNDLEQQWLLSVVVAPLGDQLNDLWLAFFIQTGATSGDFNTAAYEYLIIMGVPAGALPDMWAYAWANERVLPPFTVVDDQGNPVVDENGNYVTLG